MRSGVLVIDKPKGPTSHDVVGRLRRALRERRIGHAGTLDPAASGVLVIVIGEATKLGPFATAHDKSYDARVVLGAATDTLDAEGTVTDRAPLPAAIRDELAALAIDLAAPAPIVRDAIAGERARTTQIPPIFSAISVGGKRSYDRARAGEDVELAPRPVEARAITITGAALASPDEGSIDLAIDVSKGYYVRSLARDLGERLAVPAHLGALRRTRSGPFVIAEAAPLDADPEALARAIIPLAEAASRSLATARLTESGAAKAAVGKRLTALDFTLAPPSIAPCAWLDANGSLIAIGQSDAAGEASVIRGFNDDDG